MAAQANPQTGSKTQANLLEAIKGLTSLAEDPLATDIEITSFLDAAHEALKTYRKIVLARSRIEE